MGGTDGGLEAAELAVDDLDAQLVAGLADLGHGDLEIARHLEGLAAGQPLLGARTDLEDLDQTGDVSGNHGPMVPEDTSECDKVSNGASGAGRNGRRRSRR